MRSIALILLLSPLAGFAQKRDKTGAHQYMLRTQGTFAMGFNGKEWKYSIYGDAGFFIRDHLEMNGGISYMAGSSRYELGAYTPNVAAGSRADVRSHFLFTGPRYHFQPHKPLDLYAGFQPGVALQILDPVPQDPNGRVPGEIGLSPAASVLAGVAYYGSFFHLFTELRYIGCRYVSGNYSIGTGELRGCFGLGFNIN